MGVDKSSSSNVAIVRRVYLQKVEVEEGVAVLVEVADESNCCLEGVDLTTYALDM